MVRYHIASKNVLGDDNLNRVYFIKLVVIEILRQVIIILKIQIFCK